MSVSTHTYAADEVSRRSIDQAVSLLALARVPTHTMIALRLGVVQSILLNSYSEGALKFRYTGPLMNSESLQLVKFTLIIERSD